MRLILVCMGAVILTLAGGCQRESEPPMSSEAAYVPGRLLRALGESPLDALVAENTNHVYRFICSGTFHQPFCIVLCVTTNGTGALTMKMLSGKGGYDLGSIKEQRQAVLTAGQVEGILGLLQRENFWDLAPGEPESETGFDGAVWFLEAVRTNRYHIVQRWSPKEVAPAGRIGRGLIEAAGWKIENLY